MADEASPSGAALMLLIWQQPTDRALTGWSPLGDRMYMTDESRLRWLKDQVLITIGERDDITRVEET